MNWLIAPVFASTGRVVTQSPSPNSLLTVHAEMLRFALYDKRRDAHTSLAADSGGGLHLRVTPNRRSHACAARHAEALIAQTLFQCRPDHQHQPLLPPPPLQPPPPH